MSKVASIIVANLSTTDPYADRVVLLLYNNASLAQSAIVVEKSTELVQAGSVRYQKEAIVFDGLVLGQQYWVSAQTEVVSSGARSAQQVFAIVAGDASVPTFNYTYSQSKTLNGWYYSVQPFGMPSNIDHYAWFISPNTTFTPDGGTRPTGGARLDNLGQFHFHAATSTGTQQVWVQSVTTSGIRSNWISLATNAVPGYIDPANGEFKAIGSIPPTIGNAFSYTASTNSIGWNYPNFFLYRADLGGTVQNLSGASTFGSLSAAHKYYFFPILDDSSDADYWHTHVRFLNNGDVPGGVGDYGAAWTTLNYACIQFANRVDHVPLSVGALVASTVGSGSGGGSSGGSGVCFHSDTPVLEKTKGIVPMSRISSGDYVDSPNGWVRVVYAAFAPCELWISVKFAVEDEELLVTPNHTWVLEDDSKKTTAELTLNDLIPAKTGVTNIESLRLVRKVGSKVHLEVEDPHLYYVGKTGVQTHNIQQYPSD